METLPMPLDALGAAPGGLDEFRVAAPREVAAMLRTLYDGNIELNLNSPDGSVITATLWAVDAQRDTLGFSVEPDHPALGSLLEYQEVVIVGYIDSVKVQFDVQDLVLVRSPRGCVLNCSYPRELYRFQRRSTFRVRPLHRAMPVARVRHSDIADMQLALRVIDVSIGGCALFLPDDVPPMRPSVVLNRVLIELDADTRFSVNLRLQHVTAMNSQPLGMRLGCEFVAADSTALRALQRYIDQTQKRGRLLSID
jgi:c-di-GMP-binding flagellar brake protein YcgR